MQKGITNRLNLCVVPYLQADYQHTIDFESRESQREFFRNKIVMSVDGNYILDSERTAFLVNKGIDYLKNIDYMYTVEGPNVQCYYYFVTGIEYKTRSTTLLYVKLDVFQTHLFNYTLNNCFVDRCHVRRWNADGSPTFEVVPEDLQLTFHNVMSRDIIYDYSTKGAYIITSTEPLGVVDNRRNKTDSGTGGDSGPGNSEKWKDGYMSANGFRFLKGQEGFGQYAYNDGYGNYTIGYGVTSHGCPTEYTNLKGQEPVNETTGAQVSYNAAQKYFGSKIISKFKELNITRACQFDALIDLIYNCGLGVVTSDNSLTRALKTGDADTIRAAWEKFYILANGVQNSGLIARRKLEVDIFLNNNYVFKTIGIYNGNRVQTGTVTANNGNGWLPDDKTESNNLTVQNIYGWGYKPTSGQISAYWPTYPSGGKHTGIDIANVSGTPIYAWRGGTVKGVELGYGLSVVINHDDNKSMAIYGHNSVYYVKPGDKVVTGQKIALMGSTGNSTGPHLHFEIRPIDGAYGTDVNPWWNVKVGDKV